MYFERPFFRVFCNRHLQPPVAVQSSKVERLEIQVGTLRTDPPAVHSVFDKKNQPPILDVESHVEPVFCKIYIYIYNINIYIYDQLSTASCQKNAPFLSRIEVMTSAARFGLFVCPVGTNQNDEPLHQNEISES